MEFVHELFLTAVFAVLFSFLVAKLVSMAMGGGGDCGSDSDSKSEIIMEELQRGDKLKVERFESEKRVQFVEEAVNKVNDFNQKTVEIPEITDSGNLAEEIVTECCQLQKEEKAVLKVVDLPKESEVMVEKVYEKEKEKEKVKEKEKEEEEEEEEEASKVESENDNEVVESELKGGVKEVVGIDDDEDDWEGIERSELDKVFAAAVKFVDKIELASVGSDLQMELYGLHKVATEGPCREPQPMALMVSSRAKWNAWQRLGNMSPEVAMEQFIALLSDKVPRWMQDNSAGDSKLESPEAGISSSKDPDLSTLSSHQPNFADDRNPELKPCAEGGDVTRGSSLENRPTNDKHCSAS